MYAYSVSTLDYFVNHEFGQPCTQWHIYIDICIWPLSLHQWFSSMEDLTAKKYIIGFISISNYESHKFSGRLDPQLLLKINQMIFFGCTWLLIFTFMWLHTQLSNIVLDCHCTHISSNYVPNQLFFYWVKMNTDTQRRQILIFNISPGSLNK